MNKREMRIRILNLQDQHCISCNHRTSVHTYCINDCRIGKEIHELGAGLIFDENDLKQKITKKWDDICQQAIELRNNGYTYKKIAHQLGCHVSSLRKQLHQRGL
ncbi:zinc-finger domain-containing protein [Bacillus toyonensis]|uniref:zinc-finger domain-containing protein n=1 Tax=Bacillus toyonensis TaxID=155322 RepID=UPI0018D0A859|nr:zinc-finger domain-containing protein [Bacillus toyonensis]MBH0357690.1 hypothetical protein [Bacillus toyonensis biovar Thuringiensis]